MVAIILLGFLLLLPLASAYPLEADVEAAAEATWIKPAEKKLIFAQALWRHGARAPNQMYPTSLNSIEDFIQEEGELLEKGMEEHFLLGLRLRHRYIKQLSLVSPRFRSKEVSIRSTGYNRTIASALTNFVSFYFTGNVKGKDYPGSIFWPGYYTPVPVYAVQWKDEDLFNYLRCPRALDLNVLIPQTPEFAAFVAEYQPLLAYLNNYSGMTITNSSAYANLNVAYRVCDCILCEQAVGLPLSPWATNITQRCHEFLSDRYGQYLGIRSSSVFNGINIREEARRTFSGKLIWEIIDRFQAKLDNHFNPALNSWIKENAYFVYSAHDTSLMQLSSVLGFNTVNFETDLEPDTSDAVTMELWVGENDNSTVIKVLHFRRDILVPIDISKLIPGCENTIDGCSLEQFAAKSEQYRIIGNFNDFCASSIYNTPASQFLQSIDMNAS